MILLLSFCLILAVLAAGCTSAPAENNTTKSTAENTTTGPETFDADKGNKVVQSFLNNLYGWGKWEWRDTRDWSVGGMYQVYNFNIKDGNAKIEHTIWMAHDYNIIKITIDGVCYLSRVDYMYDYNDWESGKTTKKPNVDDYPDYSDAVNGKKTYEQIDKEFYGS